MKRSIIFLIILALFSLAVAKPIYVFKTSYVAQLTNLNFKEQVTKIRQNTNYVAVVHFYKYAGKPLILYRRQVVGLSLGIR